MDVNKKIANIPFEVVAKLHFTDEDKLNDVSSNYDEIEFKQNLMYEARKLANNLDGSELKEGYLSYKEGFEDDKKLKVQILQLSVYLKKNGDLAVL